MFPLQISANGDSADYALASWLFLRLLGLAYLAAFISLASQIRGLAGRQGILPVSDLLSRLGERDAGKFLRRPTLFWFAANDRVLVGVACAGALLATLLLFGYGSAPVLFLVWAFYLSLFNVCRTFLGYQWDVLLLEAGFLAVFLQPPGLLAPWAVSFPPRLILWAFWWLLFRLMFSSGFVKLRSRDQTWRSLTALCYHYQTQPLPTRPAWHFHQLPRGFQRASAAIALGIELLGPLLVFGPPAWRHVAAVLFIFLMVLIQLTGNYCFFNLLGIALSVLLLDDRLLASVLGRIFPGDFFPFYVAPVPSWWNWMANIAGLLILVLSLERVLQLFRLETNWPKPVAMALELLAPFHLVSSYGLFAVMTIERPEIVVEGSVDGNEWREYRFKWKPSDVKRAPGFVAPHQPRLDWQMWFAALSYYPAHPWFSRMLLRLLEGSGPVLGLLAGNPFPNAAPRYIRAILYDYRFTNRAERRATGCWWKREPRGTYCQAMTLEDFQFE